MALARHLLLTPWSSVRNFNVVHKEVKILTILSYSPNKNFAKMVTEWIQNEICWIWNLEMARLVNHTILYLFIEKKFSSYLFELLCIALFYRHNYVCFLEDAERNKLLDS